MYELQPPRLCVVIVDILIRYGIVSELTCLLCYWLVGYVCVGCLSACWDCAVSLCGMWLGAVGGVGGVWGGRCAAWLVGDRGLPFGVLWGLSTGRSLPTECDVGHT